MISPIHDMYNEGPKTTKPIVSNNSESKLSQLIKGLRGDLSQREFGKILGVSYTAIRSWEDGISFPGLNSLKKIAEYCNQPVNELIDTLNDEVNYDINPIVSERVSEKITPYIKKLPKKEQAKIAQFIIKNLSEDD